MLSSAIIFRLRTGRISAVAVSSVLVLLNLDLNPCLADSSAALSKDDILAAVKASRSTLRDIDVTFSVNVTHTSGSISGLVTRSTKRVVYRNDKICIVDRYGVEDNSKTFLTEIAYDGDKTVEYLPLFGQATVLAGQNFMTRMQGIAFFDIMLADPPRGGHGVIDQSLISALGSPYSSLRSALESVNGHSCYVLDMATPAKKIVMTVWMDPSRGFLPIQQCFYRDWKNNLTYLEFYIDSAIRTSDDLWLPVAGRKVDSQSGDHHDPVRVELQFQVEKDGADFALHVNSNVDDKIFDLESRLPAGTRVFDSRTKTAFTVGGVGLESITPAASKPAFDEKPTIPTRQQSPQLLASQDSETAWNLWDIALAAAAGFFLLLLVAMAGALAVMHRRSQRAKRGQVS